MVLGYLSYTVHCMNVSGVTSVTKTSRTQAMFSPLFHTLNGTLAGRFNEYLDRGKNKEYFSVTLHCSVGESREITKMSKHCFSASLPTPVSLPPYGG